MESKKALRSSENIESVAAIRTALRNSIKGFVDQSVGIFDSFSSAPEAWKIICKKKIEGYAQENLLNLEYMAPVLAESDYSAPISKFGAALENALESSKGAKSIRDALQIMDAGFNDALSILEKRNKELIFRR
jgi:hypothetical protein